MLKLLLGSAVAVALSVSTAAYATPTLSIGLQMAGVNGGALTTVATDASTPGQATYGLSYGTFNFNNISAQGFPAQEQGTLSTASIQTSSTAAGTISVFITAQNLTSPTGLTNFLSAFTSNVFSGSAISVIETTYYSATNQLYTGTQLATATFNAIGTSDNSTQITPSALYSETVKYVVTVGSGRASVNDTITLSATSVPEPASMALLGVGLTAVGFIRRRKSRSNS